MRCFIGLDLTMKNKLELDSWRSKSFPPLPKTKIINKAKAPSHHGNHVNKAQPTPVPAANLHITLSFLGDITPRQHEPLINALDAIKVEPFAITLNTTAFWLGPKIIVIEPKQIPESLSKLASQVNQAAAAANITTDKTRPYKPHVTLIRKANGDFPPPLFCPEIQCEFNQFHLFESFSGIGGVSYPIRKSWSLTPTSSIREQLKRGIL
jgi:2'-5' RNA ligase